MTRPLIAVAAVALTTLLSACSTMAPMSMSMPTPQAPAAVTAPVGNKVAMMAVGAGDLNYECRAKADMPGTFAWVFTGPDALLLDKNKATVGKYYGGPTWESTDVSGKQLATAPGVAGAIPLQLVQASPAMGSGAMTGVTYIQRLNTIGGVAPADVCNQAAMGSKKLVKYQADYYFYKAM